MLTIMNMMIITNVLCAKELFNGLLFKENGLQIVDGQYEIFGRMLYIRITGIMAHFCLAATSLYGYCRGEKSYTQ